MDKLNRNFHLSVEKLAGGVLEVEPPFTIEFDVQRNILSSANVGSITVYNLNENNRSQIRKDIYDYGILLAVSLRAGYGDNLPVVFQGNISKAWSVRQGVDFLTQVEAYDGGFAIVNGSSSRTFPAPAQRRTVLSSLVSDLPGVTRGTIGNYIGALRRGNAVDGSTADLLTELTGGGFFIDNGKANCLQDNECLEGEIELINSSAGLLGTPVRENTFLFFDMIFEPRLVIGQRIKLETSTAEQFDGFYRVCSLRHRGMISPVVCGEAVTRVGLAYGTEELVVIRD